ncbi:isochorismate synthase MenF [Prodigiosinella aquatilis]|nr:isochorismate synthase MenF [Prodigiosinella sp. LS101]WJV55112.1 isochorismate synthase MenF [Prodigiosinella sp. LS101]WJV59472.1 isochorismate synthase MenF [Pectobacteriaceae bacterium C111]
MKQLSGLLQRMQKELSKPLPKKAGFRPITLSMTLTETSLSLAWLASQPLYPQFYWQHRQDDEDAAVCGQACNFNNIGEAETFLQQHTADNRVRIWGLNAFGQQQQDGEQIASYLFLPRIALLRQGNLLQVCVNLFSDTSLQDDAHQALAFMRQLVPLHVLPPLYAVIKHTQHQPDRQQWIDMLHHALEDINAGKMEKVVPARATTLTLDTPLRATTFMAASRAVNHRCYHFMLAFDAHQAFLGSSPERLYLRQINQLETEALAGTVASDRDDRRAAELADWLMNDVKNQCENMLVVDDICQRLRQSALTLDVMRPEVVRLRKVQHLRRSIQVTLREASDRVCLHLLQPTAAVAGLPRVAARQFLAQHEPFDRRWYAGSAGYLSRQQSEFCVALRSADIAENILTLYAGAGIVAGSDPQQEWQELENKAAGLKSLLDGDMS